MAEKLSEPLLVDDVDGGVWCWSWTVVVDAAMFGIGVALGMLGPTLEAVAAQIGVPFVVAGTVFSFRASGYLVGALVCGPALDRLSRPALVFLLPLAAAAAGALVLPWVVTYGLLCFLFIFQGLSMGMLDTGGNVLLLALWRGSPYVHGQIHAMHFFFGLGAALSPQVVALAISAGYPTTSSWLMTGLLLLPSCLGLLLLSCTAQPRTSPEETSGASGFSGTVILTGAFLFAYVGLEVAYGGYVDRYAEKELGALPVAAARLTSLYWAMLCLGRLVAAAVTSHLNHTAYLFAHLVLATLASALLTASSVGSGNWLGASIATAAFGFALAPLFPGAIVLCEETLDRAMSGREMSATVVAAALGEMLIPSVVGLVMSEQAANFGWSILALCAIAGTCFACVLRSGGGGNRGESCTV